MELMTSHVLHMEPGERVVLDSGDQRIIVRVGNRSTNAGRFSIDLGDFKFAAGENDEGDSQVIVGEVYICDAR